MRSPLYVRYAALPLLLISLLAIGCQPKENGKTTRLRPDMRRKLNQPTIDTAGGAIPGRGGAQGTDGNPLDIPTERCNLTKETADANQAQQNTSATVASACDTILVQTEADGKIILNSLKGLENIDSGMEISMDQIKRYKTDASGTEVMDANGEFFTVQYKSIKGAKIVDGRDVLNLTYILPLQLNQLEWQSLIITINGEDVRLSQDDQTADVLVSEWTQKVMVRISNFNLIDNINFEISIRGKLKADAQIQAGAADAGAAAGAGADVEAAAGAEVEAAAGAGGNASGAAATAGTANGTGTATVTSDATTGTAASATTTSTAADSSSGVQVTVTPSN